LIESNVLAHQYNQQRLSEIWITSPLQHTYRLAEPTVGSDVELSASNEKIVLLSEKPGRNLEISSVSVEILLYGVLF